MYKLENVAVFILPELSGEKLTGKPQHVFVFIEKPFFCPSLDFPKIMLKIRLRFS